MFFESHGEPNQHLATGHRINQCPLLPPQHESVFVLLDRIALSRENDMTKKVENRKKAVVDKAVQHKLARRVVSHFLIFICVGATLGIVNQFLLNPFGSLEENLTVFFRQNTPFLLAMVCLIPIFVRDTLTLSNRIAGPIYNLRKTMQRHIDGENNVPPLRFRKNDFWPDLPAAFNAMLEKSSPEHPALAAAEQKEQELVEV